MGQVLQGKEEHAFEGSLERMMGTVQESSDSRQSLTVHHPAPKFNYLSSESLASPSLSILRAACTLRLSSAYPWNTVTPMSLPRSLLPPIFLPYC